MQNVNHQETEWLSKGILYALPFLLLTTVSCQSRPDLIRIIDSAVIDSMLVAAPVTLVSTDDPNLLTLYPEKEVAVSRDSLIYGGLYSFTLAHDSLYIADYQSSAIYVSGLEGPLVRRVGRGGHGPLEFSQLFNISFDGDQFLTFESNRVQVLSKELSFVSMERISTLLLREGTVTRTYLYGLCSRGHAYRVCPRDQEKPGQVVAQFVKSLGISSPPLDISFGVAASLEGDLIVAAFMGLPYLFIFNEHHEHVHTLRFYGSRISRHAENYQLEGDPSLGVGLQYLWTNIYVLKPNLIAVTTEYQTYFIRVLDGKYEHIATAQFSLSINESKGDIESEITATQNMILHEGYFYLNAWMQPHILRYRADILPD